MDKTIGIWILLCLTVSWGSVVHAKTSSSDIDAIIDPILRVPKGHSVQQDLFAVGFQIYNFNGTAWALRNVSADLYDFKGRRVGFHYFLKEKDSNGGQPTWETLKPQSRVTAKAIAVVPQPDAISLVLLEFTSRDGDMRLFGSTTFVQRLFTQKGLPPSTEKAKIGDVYKSYYTTLYTFSSNRKGR